jgi:hypothetical protein
MLKLLSMNTQLQGIPSTGRSSDDHLIPAPAPNAPSLIERLAAAHASVLENWNAKFALDLRRHRVVAVGSKDDQFALPTFRESAGSAAA